MSEPSQFPVHWPGARPIPGFPGYIATADGHVVSLRCSPPRILREDPDRDGYPYVLAIGRGRRRRLLVHRAVALAFHGEPLHRMQMAANAEGTTLGEWLYDALSEPFDFTGKWGVPGKAERRKKYNAAAKAFAAKIADALADEGSVA
jgi:hypothetical protein